jgi:uncharacterized membrane protein YdjX (TVP38/TMEM64 family)
MAANIDAAPAAERLTIKRLLPLVVLLAVPVLAYVTGAYKLFSFEVLAQYYATLKDWIGAHYLLALLAYIAFYATATALSLPAGLVITVAGGLFFGWAVGGPATVVGATIGATILFMVAKTSLGAGLAKQAGPWLEKLSEGFRKDAFNYLLFLRLVPAFPFVVVNLVPALLGMPLWSYVAATFIGIIPGTLTFSYLGTGLESVIQAATASYQTCLAGKSAAEAVSCHLSVDATKLVTPQILIALGALAAVSLLPIVIKRFFGKQTA